MEAYALNYNVVYFGRGMQIARMLIAYFGPNIKFINKEPIFPIDPVESDVVGIRLMFEVYNQFELEVTILDDVNFEVKSLVDGKVYNSKPPTCDFWPMEQAIDFKYDLRDEAVKKRIKYLSSRLKTSSKN